MLIMEVAYTQVENLNSVELAEMCGNANLTTEDDRTPLQQLLVRCEARLKIMWAVAERARSLAKHVEDEICCLCHSAN